MATTNKIDINTMIPVSIVITIVGGAFWLGAMYRENQQTQSMLQEFRKEYKADMAYINQKIDKILLSNNEKKVALNINK